MEQLHLDNPKSCSEVAMASGNGSNGPRDVVFDVSTLTYSGRLCVVSCCHLKYFLLKQRDAAVNVVSRITVRIERAVSFVDPNSQRDFIFEVMQLLK